jgi:DNA-binding CsgD family transcriptional regulator/tetratricopeptide (TPR) repeat protein
MTLSADEDDVLLRNGVRRAGWRLERESGEPFSNGLELSARAGAIAPYAAAGEMGRRGSDATHEAARVSPAARELCAEGVQAWQARTAQSLNRALDAFTAALQISGEYAEALAGLANTFLLLREYTLMPDAQAYPLAEAAARRALASDDTLPQAHAALAFVAYWGRWDAEAAEREFQLAISLGRGWATAHHWFANFLAARGSFPRARAEIERALELDPSCLSIQADRALLFWHCEGAEEAVAELERVAALSPHLASPHRYLSDLCLVVGREADYLREARLLAGIFNDHVQLAALGAAEAGLAAGGRAGLMSTLVADRIERAHSGTVTAYSVAWLSAIAGNAEDALSWLQRSLDKREAEFVQVIFAPALSHLLGEDPSFKALVNQVRPTVERRFASARGLGGEFVDVLDRSCHALFLLCPDGRLRFTNLAAERMLCERDGLHSAAGRLSAVRPSDARRLQEMIRAAALSDGESGRGYMALGTPSRSRPLSVTVAPLRSDRTRGFGEGFSILLRVTDLDAGPRLTVQRLRDLFGLTPAEARLALALVEGLPPAQAAARFGLSRNTVQAQLARIFEKTGVARQSGLMRLMMRLADTAEGQIDGRAPGSRPPSTATGDLLMPD